MAGHNTQNRDRGYRHSNLKPHPHKKNPRVPGEGRYREEGEPGYWHLWFAWNHRRKLRFPNRDINPIVVAKEYENMSANMYRHNMEAKRTFDSAVGWTRTGPALVRPEQYRAEMFPKRGLVGGTKREMLGEGRVGRMKKLGGMTRKKGKGPRWAGKSEIEEHRSQADEDRLHDSKSDGPIEFEDQQPPQEELEWIDVEKEIEPEMEDDYVVI